MIKNGQITKFSSYSQFQSVEEFNEHMTFWLQNYGRQFSKAELIGLTQLTRYAVKVVGVANLKIGTALKVIHEHYNGNGISRSTFKRMLVKAKKIGLLTVHELKRNSGGQSSNLYVFMPYPVMINNQEKTQGERRNQRSDSHSVAQSELPYQQKLNHQETNSFKTKTINNEKNRSRELINFHNHSQKSQPQTSSATVILDHTYTSDQIPKQFINLVKAYFNNCETIEEYWRMAKLAAYQYLFESDISYVLDTAIHSFKQTIRKIKKATVKKPIAYFYTVTLNKFSQQFYQPEDDSVDEVGGVYAPDKKFLNYLSRPRVHSNGSLKKSHQFQ